MQTIVNETNPLGVNGNEYHGISRRRVDWTEPGLKVTRLRLLTDAGCPVMDVSYCYGVIGTEDVEVDLPFGQLNKARWKSELYTHAKKTGRYIAGLFDAVSVLW